MELVAHSTQATKGQTVTLPLQLFFHPQNRVEISSRIYKEKNKQVLDYVLSSGPNFPYRADLMCVIPPRMRQRFNMFILSCCWQAPQHVSHWCLYECWERGYLHPVTVLEDICLLPPATIGLI